MKRLGLALCLGLMACTTPSATPPTASSGTHMSGVSLVDAKSGEILVGSIVEGSSLDLAGFGLRDVAFQAVTPTTSYSKLEFSLDGETSSDSQSPYTTSALDSADWRLGTGSHTLTVTPFNAAGNAQSPLELSFSVKGLDYKRYLYVFGTTSISVFDIDNGHQKVKSIKLPPGIQRIWGAVAHAESRRLYISYHGVGSGANLERGLLAYDLVTEQLLWKELYSPFVDSPAITKDGKTLYLSSGEATDRGTFWFVIDAADGTVKDTIEVHRGAHNTIVGLSDKYVYMGSVRYPYLVMADTATNEIVRQIGPFRDGVRPFTVNGKETLAFVNVNRFLGFEVGDVATGKVLHSVHVEGFPEGPWTKPLHVQSHGVALSPDETEVWIVDSKNRHVHLYEVTGLPQKAPAYITSIKLPSPPTWVQFSRDGRFAYTSGGEVIDAKTHKIVAQTAYAKVRIQIDTLADQPVRSYVRYGLGYVTE